MKDIEPIIWRRIQVPETYSFWDLHVAIQDSMGWLDSHLHGFHIVNPSTEKEEHIGIPDDEGFDDDIEVLPGWEFKIADYFSEKNSHAEYDYDFGDYWQHEILLEKILPGEAGVRYPLCIDGQRACPPEDCGGTDGYEDFLNIIMDPSHEEYEETLTWAGDEFDPEEFNPKKVHFDNPQSRLKIMLKG